MRSTTTSYGSPHDGLSGLRRCHQFLGLRSAPSPLPNDLPSKTLVDSIRRGSVCTSSPVSFAERGGRLLRALERRGADVHDVAVTDRFGDPLGHRPAELGEVVARPAAVEDALGVVHLAVSQQVDDRR